MPTNIGEALAESDDLINARPPGEMRHVVEARATQTGSVEPYEFCVGSCHRYQGHAFIRAACRGDRIDGDRIVGAVAGRLHDDAMLYTKPLVQPEQQVLWRIRGRVVPPLGKRKTLAWPEHMHMRVAGARWQFQPGFAGRGHPVRGIGRRACVMLHHASLARVCSKAGSWAVNRFNQSTRMG